MQDLEQTLKERAGSSIWKTSQEDSNPALEQNQIIVKLGRDSALANLKIAGQSSISKLLDGRKMSRQGTVPFSTALLTTADAVQSSRRALSRE